MRRLLIIFVIFISTFLMNAQKSDKSRIIIFDHIGQKEAVKINEKVNLIIDKAIKPEFAYFSYKTGKNNEEYIIQLKTNENYLREIYNLKNSNDSLLNYFKILKELNQAESKKGKISESNTQTGSNITDTIETDPRIIRENRNKELNKEREYSIFEVGISKKRTDSLKQELKKIDEQISRNIITISNNSKKIDTLKKQINDIDNSGQGIDKLESIKASLDSLIKLNNLLINENKGLNEHKMTLEQELMREVTIYGYLIRIITFLAIITLLIIILAIVFYRIYKQKKIFSIELSSINSKLETSNEDLNKLLKTIKKDLSKASEYVYSIIPAPFKSKEISLDWVLIPSIDLGGDTLGYNWIDSDNFAFYLVDVSGHGSGAALHSVQILNILQSKSLLNVDFKNPKQVLSSLNNIFQMEDHNYIYFTMFYGIFNKTSNELSYASAGHPPAILYNNRNVKLLESQNTFIGADRSIKYNFDTLKIEAGSNLYVFSDGAYEYKDKSGKMFKFKDFSDQLIDKLENKKENLNSIYDLACKNSGQDNLEDDFTIIKIKF